MKNTEYSNPIIQLLTMGKCELSMDENDWPDYPATGISEKDIPELIKIVTDKDLLKLDGKNPMVWASLHAWRALGQLKAVLAIEPIIAMLEEYNNDDYAMSELPIVIGMIGGDAIAPLGNYLMDDTKDEWARVIAANSFTKIALKSPEKRNECVNILSGFLDVATSDTASLNGLIAADLVDLDAKEAIESIRNACQRDIIDEGVQGDIEDIEIALGFRKTRETPKKQSEIFKKFREAMKQSPIFSDNDDDYVSETVINPYKLGRNDPCHCGSGKKYKKCCL